MKCNHDRITHMRCISSICLLIVLIQRHLSKHVHVTWILLSVHVFHFYTHVIVKMCRYACKSSIGITLVTKNMYPHVTKVIGYCIVEKSTEAIFILKIFVKKMVKFVTKAIKSIHKNTIIK